jgi:glycosyltransferase involved in cell wall biosynthesis
LIKTDALVSIVMPAYNVGPYIAEAIESVIAQTYQNWELLIINDGSTDDTEQVVQQFTDPRIRYFHTEHLGIPASVKNIGLKNAIGEFITFQDSDDGYFPDSLDRLLKPFNENPNLLAAMGFPYLCDNKLKLVQISKHLKQVGDNKYQLDHGYSLCWENICLYRTELYLCGTMLKKQVVEQLGLLDERLVTSEDFKYLVQLFELGLDKVGVIPHCVFKYRQHSQSITKDPVRLFHSYDSDILITNWLFSRSFINNDLLRNRAIFMALKLSIVSRCLVKMNRPDLARRIIFRTLLEESIPLKVWIKYFGKQLLRTLAPRPLELLYMHYVARDTWRYV